MELILFLLFIMYMIFSLRSLRDRVSILEKKIKSQNIVIPIHQPKLDEPSPIPPPVDIISVPFTPNTISMPVSRVADESKPQELFLYTWFKEQTLIKIGSIIFFLGAVWFVGYAIEQNWISPLMRIVLGLLLACSIYVIGFWRSNKAITQYQVLTVLGSSIFFGTVIASQFAFVKPVLPATVAFVLMTISVVYTIFVAYKTKVEWLAISACVAGLVVPLLIKTNDPSPVLLMVYLLVLSASLLLVVFITNWRLVSLTLLVGTAIHLSNLAGSTIITDNTLWFFVVLFSILFCAGTTISIARTNQPLLHDVIALGIIVLQFVGYVLTVSLFPAVALFIAAAVAGFIGYSLRMQNSHADSVSLYVAASTTLILIGTAELFDGVVLTIVYALEALSLFMLSLRLATVNRSIYIAAGLFLIPIMTGWSDLASDVWKNGIMHKEALGTLTVSVTLAIAFVRLLSDKILQSIDWLRHIAGALVLSWYGFVMSAIFVIGFALYPSLEYLFSQTMLLLAIAMALILYVLNTVDRDSWKSKVLFTLFVPTISGIALFTHPAWSSGISHQLFLGSLIYLLGLIIITCYYWLQTMRLSRTQSLLSGSSFLLTWITLGYSMLFFTSVWNALLTGSAKIVVISVTYTALIYFVINCLMYVRTNANRVISPLVLLIIPGLMSLQSLSFSGWNDGTLGVDAIGLYVITTILFLLATTLHQYMRTLSGLDRNLVRTAAYIIYSLSAVLSFLLVWIISQTVFTYTFAVTIALFVYTVAGLITYSYGRSKSILVWKRVGVILLSAVVLRLGLVDVWGMELVWRIFTFLGIGLLFIITALFERSSENT